MTVWHDSCLADAGRERKVAVNTHLALHAQRDAVTVPGLLEHLGALTFDFSRDGRKISAVLVYAEPDPETPGAYRAVAANDAGYEGIACLDDTARAATLALGVYERTHSRSALQLAYRWLTFVEYMQYPDGSFANFIRNAAGIRNATGPTSRKGGYAWSVRALRALARAYRLTGRDEYLERYRACRLAPVLDGKINGALVLAEFELVHTRERSHALRTISEYAERIVEVTDDAPYLLDQPQTQSIHLWGYHQLEALARAAGPLDRPELLRLCRQTVQHLAEPCVRAKMWRDYPGKQKDGLTSYDVSPLVTGLAALYETTGTAAYRRLALQAASWFYGRNDARTAMYDPTTGRCRDGISGGVPSRNFGAESSIEAGMAELARRSLLQV